MAESAPRSTCSHCGSAKAEDQRVPASPSTAAVAGNTPGFSDDEAVAELALRQQGLGGRGAQRGDRAEARDDDGDQGAGGGQAPSGAGSSFGDGGEIGDDHCVS
nr:hypothetical protein GCM10020092_102440 [Actinoplanes digitatis]